MSILTSVADLQKYVNVVGTFDPLTVLPYVNDAQAKYMGRFLGGKFMAELDAFVTSGSTPAYEGKTEPETKTAFESFLPFVKNPLAAFGFFLAAPFLDLKITDSGFAVVNSSNLSPASAERVRKFTASMEQTGFDRLENMLVYLESNKDSFPSWTGSDAYTFAMGNFIVHAEMFDQILSINQSRLKFQSMRPTMNNVELLQIEPVISSELAREIHKQIRENSFTDPVKILLPMIRRAAAYLTAGIDIDPKFKGMGDMYLSKVKKYLDANTESFPLYAESDCYDPEKTSYSNFNNQEDSSFFVFGS
jgi:hypothetical protein